MVAKQPFRIDVMDVLDRSLIGLLRKEGRASLSELAATLGVTRSTIRARLEKLQGSGEIAGFTVQTRADVTPQAVRGLMMLAIEGRGTARIARTLKSKPEVTAVHSTNGAWDLIVQIGVTDLRAFDRVLNEVRLIEGVLNSETSLLLSTF